MNRTELSEISLDAKRPDNGPVRQDEESVLVDDQGLPISAAGDIVFNCPQCGHQLVIDVRGAGLTVNCTECGESVQVPIPEGMEVADLDEPPEQLFAQSLQLRRTLSRAEERIAELERVVASLMERRSVMEKARLATLHRCVEMGNLLQAVLRNQSEITLIVQRVQSLLAEEQK